MKRRLTFALTLALAAGMLVLVPGVLGSHAVVGPNVEVIDDNNNVDGGLANVWSTMSADAERGLVFLPVSTVGPDFYGHDRPGDNLFTSSAIAFDVETGKMTWYFQYTPNDNRDYDEAGTHILIDTPMGGEERTWTKGINPTTGKPVEYDPKADFQLYAEGPDVNNDRRARRVCPDTAGGNNYWPATYSPRTRLIYIPGNEGCATVTPDYRAHVKGNFAGGTTTDAGRITSSIVALDPSTNEVKFRKDLPYPNFAGTVSTAGGIVFTALLDGTILALDDQTLEELWSVNVGTGFNAPPMTYSVGGKQYVAIASGLFRNAKNKLARSPELRNLANATIIFVVGLD